MTDNHNEKPGNSERSILLQKQLDAYTLAQNNKVKTNEEIGAEYERFVGYKYVQKGYQVFYNGIVKGYDDQGIDLIAKKSDHIIIIQCKNWKQSQYIHEKYIDQLGGVRQNYCVENHLPLEHVKVVLVTSARLSETAQRHAQNLKIEFIENFHLDEFPQIKCCIIDEAERQAKIYRLPFDQNYDEFSIGKPGETFTWTVLEAEQLGFFREHQWVQKEKKLVISELDEESQQISNNQNITKSKTRHEPNSKECKRRNKRNIKGYFGAISAFSGLILIYTLGIENALKIILKLFIVIYEVFYFLVKVGLASGLGYIVSMFLIDFPCSFIELIIKKEVPEKYKTILKIPIVIYITMKIIA